MSKVLFSTALGPYKEQHFNTCPTDIGQQRYFRGDGIFGGQGHQIMEGLHVIAQNISAPSVVLQYPRKDDFIRELKKGYDYVGISSFHNQVPSVIDMCKLARRYAPGSKIVLGGFGAVGIEACLPKKEQEEICDYICHEEGANYMRRLLGEDTTAPLVQSHLPKWTLDMPVAGSLGLQIVPVLIGSVGCINGCDFCGTTEMFSQKRIELLSPKQVHAECKRIWRENPWTPSIGLFEEDSFMDKEYISEVGRLLREDEEFGLSHYNFTCLSSNRAFSRWEDWDDIMLTGISNVFIGVESKFAHEEGYAKRTGLTMQETFKRLHQRGITTIGAWMAGFDFQNPDNIEEDLAEFVSLCPSAQQLTRLCPFPATPLWRDMKETGRIRDDVVWEDINFFGGGGAAPQHFTEEQIMKIIDDGYKRMYQTWGPTMTRYCEVALNGYEHCMSVNKNKYYRDRAQFHKRWAKVNWVMLKAAEIYAPNNIVRKRMKDIDRRYRRVLGEPNAAQKAMSAGMIGMAGFLRFRETFFPFDNVLREEPFTKYTYHKNENPGECPYTEKTYERITLRNPGPHVRSGINFAMRNAHKLLSAYEKIGGRLGDEGRVSVAPEEIATG